MKRTVVISDDDQFPLSWEYLMEPGIYEHQMNGGKVDSRLIISLGDKDRLLVEQGRVVMFLPMDAPGWQLDKYRLSDKTVTISFTN